MKCHASILHGIATAALASLSSCQTPYSKSEERDPLGYLIEAETEASPSDPASRLMDRDDLH